MNKFETDIVIIGAGPVGLFSIFEAGMLKIKCHVIDSLENIGGQCTALYPEKPIYDIPAHPRILASELIENLEQQANPFNPTYHLNQRVDKLEKTDNNNFIVTTSKNNIIKCKAVIIAAGCGAFGPNRPPLPNIEQYEGSSVFYAIRDKSIFKNKNVVIAGGGDSAVDWAINLSEICNKIYVIHRREKFRCAPESLNKMKDIANNGNIELIIPYQLDSIKGSDDKLNKVLVKDFDNNIKELDADYLLPFFGLAMELGPIAKWGLNLEKNHISVDPTNMQTSESGIYAIGDIATYKNKLKLILTGFSEAALAIHDIYKIIYPDEIFHFEYSTSKGVANS
ncbi:MAG: ferredoxin--NADP(+) reductase [Rickettsiales bacterium]|jgi:thioredoxin reductase (NADPH)|nr:ferredoxin--NADP(+) reductase [Rickettsiales bacterium]|tara:strand:- start:12007 stop:13020 length:1014 start_codon:yes stop_codon:yes gene_type:complete